MHMLLHCQTHTELPELVASTRSIQYQESVAALSESLAAIEPPFQPQELHQQTKQMVDIAVKNPNACCFLSVRTRLPPPLINLLNRLSQICIIFSELAPHSSAQTLNNIPHLSHLVSNLLYH